MEAALNFPLQPTFRGSVIKEYLLVAGLQSDLLQQVTHISAALKHAFGGDLQLETTAHLQLAAFLAKEEMEDTILRWMQRLISRQPAFDLSLVNFGGSAAGKSIHLRVQDAAPFQSLARELRVIDELVQSNGLPAAQLVSQPKLRLATAGSASVFRRAMMEYSAKDFHSVSRVKELVLLKRTGPFDPATQVNIFHLHP